MKSYQKQVLVQCDQLVTMNDFYVTPENPLGVIPEGAVAMDGSTIAWVGPTRSLPLAWLSAPQIDMKGKTVFPGFIDSHTHPIFAGNRADEFEARLQGKSYQEIAKGGGGILKTVDATRRASEVTLYELTKIRLLRSLSFGVTTIEAKSGYGLTTGAEIKSLRVLQRLKKELPMTVVPTFMGAHDIPPEYRNNPEGYVNLICREMIPAVAEQKLAEHCDVFCEEGYFTVEQSRKILLTGLEYGLTPRIHAEEFNNLESAAMSCDIGALSADHLLYLSDAGIERLASSRTVATVLPGTAFYLKMKQYAPARKLLDAGATVALATDFNPGSCMSQNIQLMMVFGCLYMGMLPHEAIRAVTINAAKALSLDVDRGSLEAGKRADLAIFSMQTYNELMYHFGVNRISEVWVGGTRVYTQPSLNVQLIYS